MRAAIAYAGKGQQPAMDALNYSRATLARLLDTKGGDRKTIEWSDLWKLADVCGLPREWFTADFERLYEIVPDGMPTFTRSAAAPPPAPPGPLLRPVVDPRPKPGTDDDASRPGEADSQ